MSNTNTRTMLWTMLAAAVVFAIVGSIAFRGSPIVERDTSPDQHKMRVVSLSPSVTEMLFAIGAGDLLVGATDYCDYPPEAKQIERVGGLGRPNMEKLLALSPDLVVATDFDRGGYAQTLRQSGVQVLDAKIRSLDELFERLLQLGDAVGKQQQAKAIVANMQTELKSVAAQFADAPRPRVFVEIWDDPLTTVGGSSFLDDVVTSAGGVNVAHEITVPHPRISAEKVIEWNPDVIVVAHMYRGATSASQMAERIGWADIAAVKNRRVLCDIPTDLILRPGPRLIDGVKLLAQRLHEGATSGATSGAMGKRSLPVPPGYPNSVAGAMPTLAVGMRSDLATPETN
jgi:iron complex transport system substrate-binding protein